MKEYHFEVKEMAKKRRIRYDRLLLIIVGAVAVVGAIILLFIMLFVPNKKDLPKEEPEVTVEKTPYEEFYFYNKSNHERYVAYYELHPEYSYEEVVWHVNSNLDKEFYSEITTISDFNTVPLLVNKYYALPSDYVPPNLVTIEGDRRMDADAYEAFKEMKAAAAEEGYTLTIVSAYRSYSYQKDLYNSYLSRYNNDQAQVDTFSAREGHSEHQTGLAIDICGANGDYMKFEGTDEQKWVAEHAHEYGFIVRYGEDIIDQTGYKYEPWHLRYVGVKIATFMKDNNIRTLEEYVIKYVEYRGE